MDTRLQPTFTDLIAAHDPGLAQELWQEIVTAYTKRRRYYHTLQHLDNMLSQLEEVRSFIDDWEIVLFSLFYHDIVYNALRKDNEEESADLAGKRLAQLGAGLGPILKCREQILATKGHAISASMDTNYFTDADLSILGAEADLYDAYAQDVRKEYSIYPDLIYKPGRKKVLEHFLSMERIFKTDYFFNKLEAPARENLRRELGR